MKNKVIIWFFALASSTMQGKVVSCESDHKIALRQCSSYEHTVEVDQLENVGSATKKRIAETESEKLFGYGRACAKAQKRCLESCQKELDSDSPQVDLTRLIEFQNDCAQGSVAAHRSNLAKRYLGMKSLAEATRDPARTR